jgi:hypothetical protein
MKWFGAIEKRISLRAATGEQKHYMYLEENKSNHVNKIYIVCLPKGKAS